MGWYIVRRIAIMVPVFIGATLLIYGMVFLLPGDPVAAMAGDRPLTPVAAAALRARYHLDDPFILQYLRYLGGVLHGDLGRSFSGLPVSAVLAHAFPVTVRLALIAVAVEAVAVTIPSSLRRPRRLQIPRRMRRSPVRVRLRRLLSLEAV